MENLYAIDDMLYTYDELVKNELEEDVQYSYLELGEIYLGNDIYLIIDNNNTNFEVIKKIEEGIYKSLTIESVEILESVFKNL